jgi:UDP:flavonoid glycosyltransferase YjiC (YdhE family)
LEAQKAAAPEVFEFLQSAMSDAGVVFVGFGSTGLFGNTMSRQDFIELAAGFSDLAPTRVLWPMSTTNLPGNLTLEDLALGDNVKVVSWVDYNDVLGHPSVKVFMTHCGVHSMMEAAFHGVAVVAIPFQFEQKENCLKLVSAGMGEMAVQAVGFRTKDPGIRFTREYVRDILTKVRRTQDLVHLGLTPLTEVSGK